jgi:hypothetical protein
MDGRTIDKLMMMMMMMMIVGSVRNNGDGNGMNGTVGQFVRGRKMKKENRIEMCNELRPNMNFWGPFSRERGGEGGRERMGKRGGREGGEKKVRSNTHLSVRRRDVTSSTGLVLLFRANPPPASRSLFLTLFSSGAVQVGTQSANRKPQTAIPTDSEEGDAADVTELEFMVVTPGRWKWNRGHVFSLHIDFFARARQLGWVSFRVQPLRCPVGRK